MKVLDYLLIIGCIVSLVAGIFFDETSWPRDLLRFITGFCAGGLVVRIGRRLQKE